MAAQNTQQTKRKGYSKGNKPKRDKNSRGRQWAMS